MVAKRAHKFNSSVDLSVEIFKLGATYWHKVYAEVAKEAILPYGELSFINGIGDYINLGKLPSPKQCKQLMKIIDKIENTPIKIGFFVWLMQHFKKLSITGFSDFLIDFYLIMLLFILILVIAFANRLKIKYYKGKIN